MKVMALTAFSLGGGRDVYPGDVFDMSEQAAEDKMRRTPPWVTQNLSAKVRKQGEGEGTGRTHPDGLVDRVGDRVDPENVPATTPAGREPVATTVNTPTTTKPGK